MLAALGLAACTAFQGPSAVAPPGVNFSGIWKLDRRLSTDSKAALEHVVRRGPAASRTDHGGGGPQAGLMPSEAAYKAPVDLSLQKSLLSGGEYLEIKQRDDVLEVSNGETTETLVAGESSVVSVPEGAADRRSGWKGKQFWVELHPEFGPDVTEKFRLRQGGKRLVETIDIAGHGRVRRLVVTRVYRPASSVPTLLPEDN